MPPASRARRRAEIRWFLAFHALAWAITAAQSPPALQPAAQPPAAPDLPLPALPPEPVDQDDQLSLPTVPLTPPRPKTGRGGVSSFVEGLKGNDAIVEVVLGQGRILTTRSDLSGQASKAVIAVGDPSVMDFVVLGPRQLRLSGQRLGTTDLSITATDGQIFNFEVHVVADLTLLEKRLKALFPDTSLTLSQASGSVVVEGEARNPSQISKIIQIITTHVYALTAPVPPVQRGAGGGLIPSGAPDQGAPSQTTPPAPVPMGQPTGMGMGMVTPELAPSTSTLGTALGPPRIINLIRLPTSQQVLLKVRVAELNRSALRRIGANFLGVDPKNGAIIGSQISGPTSALGLIGHSLTLPQLPGRDLNAGAQLSAVGNTTVFGIFQDSHFEFMLSALRQNAVLKILAEPNLVALSGQRASFLAGGEFPVPIPQVSGSGVAPTITVSFKRFGVLLDFLPIIVDDDVIRLAVAPEVSQIDNAIAITLVAGGSPVPGLNTRKVQTTVELRQGQTLAIAGLLQLELDGTTNRIPYLGDLPVLGPFFSNTEGRRIEKELLVLVTPYLVEPMHKWQVPPGPGDEVKEPSDLEFYMLGRIEGRTGRDVRSTTSWDDPFHISHVLDLEKNHVAGPSGFSK